jgi:hypothetical protein
MLSRVSIIGPLRAFSLGNGQWCAEGGRGTASSQGTGLGNALPRVGKAPAQTCPGILSRASILGYHRCDGDASPPTRQPCLHGVRMAWSGRRARRQNRRVSLVPRADAGHPRGMARPGGSGQESSCDGPEPPWRLQRRAAPCRAPEPEPSSGNRARRRPRTLAPTITQIDELV